MISPVVHAPVGELGLLEEETGYRAGRVEHLITFQSMVGMVDSEHVVFTGRDGEKISPISSTIASDGAPGVVRPAWCGGRGGRPSQRRRWRRPG